ncbi:MAG TPA: hypothetical protein VMS64_00710 [Candidatus Methylomirabilis sp.]|nr:hypothetical protein [Candidatus Methylomirabilis sp.]
MACGALLREQVRERVNGQFSQTLALGQKPVLEACRLAGKAVEEVPAVERHSGLEGVG